MPLRSTLSFICNPLTSICRFTHSISSAVVEIRSSPPRTAAVAVGQEQVVEGERNEDRKKRKRVADAMERRRTGTVRTNPFLDDEDGAIR